MRKKDPLNPFWCGLYSISRLPLLHLEAALASFHGNSFSILGHPLPPFLGALTKIITSDSKESGPFLAPHIFSYISSSSVRGESCAILTNVLKCFRQDRPTELVNYSFKDRSIK